MSLHKVPIQVLTHVDTYVNTKVSDEVCQMVSQGGWDGKIDTMGDCAPGILVIAIINMAYHRFV